MKREVLETGTATTKEPVNQQEDGGMVKAQGHVIYVPFDIRTASDEKRFVRGKARIVDTLYNSLRYTLKDTSALSVRLHMECPRDGVRSGGA